MGVRGLTTFIDKRKKWYFEDYKLHSTKLIIDGCSLRPCLYFNPDMTSDGGLHMGESQVYYNFCVKFFRKLIACKIDCYVVFDGGMDVDGKKIDTIRNRCQGFVDDAVGTIKGERSVIFTSHFTSPALFSAMRDMGVTYVFGDFESDRDIVVLANELQCPVLGYDSDYMIMDIHHGYIPLNTLDWEIVSQTSPETTECASQDSVDFLPCKRYHVSNFCNIFLVNQSVLPLFASLIGNDYVRSISLDSFYWDVKQKAFMKPDRKPHPYCKGYPYDPKFCRLLHHLTYFASQEECLNEVVRNVHKTKQAAVKSALIKSCAMYDVTRPSTIVQHVLSKAGSAVFKSQLVEEHGLLEGFVKLMQQGEIDIICQNILLNKTIILYSTVEDMSQPRSSMCADNLRKILFGILFADSVKESKPIEQDHVVNMFARDGESIKCHRVRPVYTVGGFGGVLSLREIPETDEKHRRSLLLAALKADSLNLDKVPEIFHITLIITVYWLSVAEPVIPQNILKALVLGWVQGVSWYKKNAWQISQNSNLPADLFQLSFRWSDYDVLTVLQNFDPFISKPLQSFISLSVNHALAQWQACVTVAILLNAVLLKVFPMPPETVLFNGILIHNLYHRLKAIQPDKHGEWIENTLLCNVPNAYDLYQCLMTFLNSHWECISKKQCLQKETSNTRDGGNLNSRESDEKSETIKATIIYREKLIDLVGDSDSEEESEEEESEDEESEDEEYILDKWKYCSQDVRDIGHPDCKSGTGNSEVEIVSPISKDEEEIKGVQTNHKDVRGSIDMNENLEATGNVGNASTYGQNCRDEGANVIASDGKERGEIGHASIGGAIQVTRRGSDQRDMETRKEVITDNRCERHQVNWRRQDGSNVQKSTDSRKVMATNIQTESELASCSGVQSNINMNNDTIHRGYYRGNIHRGQNYGKYREYDGRNEGPEGNWRRQDVGGFPQGENCMGTGKFTSRGGKMGCPSGGRPKSEMNYSSGQRVVKGRVVDNRGYYSRNKSEGPEGNWRMQDCSDVCNTAESKDVKSTIRQTEWKKLGSIENSVYVKRNSKKSGHSESDFHHAQYSRSEGKYTDTTGFVIAQEIETNFNSSKRVTLSEFNGRGCNTGQSNAGTSEDVESVRKEDPSAASELVGVKEIGRLGNASGGLEQNELKYTGGTYGHRVADSHGHDKNSGTGKHIVAGRLVGGKGGERLGTSSAVENSELERNGGGNRHNVRDSQDETVKKTNYVAASDLAYGRGRGRFGNPSGRVEQSELRNKKGGNKFHVIGDSHEHDESRMKGENTVSNEVDVEQGRRKLYKASKGVEQSTLKRNENGHRLEINLVHDKTSMDGKEAVAGGLADGRVISGSHSRAVKQNGGIIDDVEKRSSEHGNSVSKWHSEAVEREGNKPTNGATSKAKLEKRQDVNSVDKWNDQVACELTDDQDRGKLGDHGEGLEQSGCKREVGSIATNGQIEDCNSFRRGKEKVCNELSNEGGALGNLTCSEGVDQGVVKSSGASCEVGKDKRPEGNMRRQSGGNRPTGKTNLKQSKKGKKSRKKKKM